MARASWFNHSRDSSVSHQATASPRSDKRASERGTCSACTRAPSPHHHRDEPGARKEQIDFPIGLELRTDNYEERLSIASSASKKAPTSRATSRHRNGAADFRLMSLHGWPATLVRACRVLQRHHAP